MESLPNGHGREGGLPLGNGASTQRPEHTFCCAANDAFAGNCTRSMSAGRTGTTRPSRCAPSPACARVF